MVLDAYGNGIASGTPADVAGPNGGSAQGWLVVPVNSGWIRAVDADGPDVAGISIGQPYDPSVIKTNGSYFIYFCSYDPIAHLDGIRVTESADGIIGDLRALVEEYRTRRTKEPRVIPRFLRSMQEMARITIWSTLGPDGPHLDTAMYIARSQSPLGPFPKYSSTDGGWEINSPHPSIIVAPQRRGLSCSYRAGSSELVVHNGLLYMWYDDTTTDPNSCYQDRLYLTTSADGIHWSALQDTRLPMSPGGLRYDPGRSEFVLVEPGASGFQEYTSYDAVNWSAPQSLIIRGLLGSGRSALLGDDQGSILPNDIRVFSWATDIKGIWGNAISLAP
jgi:hypothetical protein